MIKRSNKPVLFYDVSCKLQIWEMDSFSDNY
jgi:hypothetical protein